MIERQPVLADRKITLSDGKIVNIFDYRSPIDLGDLRMPSKEGQPLSPRELQVFELKAMGLTYEEISESLGIRHPVTKKYISFGLEKTGKQTSIEAIVFLMETQSLDKEKITQGLEFENYHNLSEKQKEYLNEVSNPSSWNKNFPKISHDLKIAEHTLRQRLCETYKLIEVPHLLRARLFHYLMPRDLIK